MADIKAKCNKCGKEVMVSEYAATDGIPCTCGGTIKPESRQTPSRTFRLKPTMELQSAPPAQKPEQTPPAPPPPSPATMHSALTARRVAREKRKEKISIFKVYLSVVLFLALAAALGYFRFRYGPAHFSEAYFNKIIQYGVIAIGAVYVLSMILALKDNMFDGLLSFIPFYPLYYLFAVSGAVFLKAIAGALLVGFGTDFIAFLQKYANSFFNFVNTWIRSH